MYIYTYRIKYTTKIKTNRRARNHREYEEAFVEERWFHQDGRVNCSFIVYVAVFQVSREAQWAAGGRRTAGRPGTWGLRPRRCGADNPKSSRHDGLRTDYSKRVMLSACIPRSMIVRR